MSNLTSPVWWKAVLFRALRTAGVIAAPYIPTILYTQDWFILSSVVGFAVLGSFLTSLKGIPESDGATVGFGWAMFERTIKTAAQALLTFFGTATMFSQVTWNELLPFVGTAVLGSLLIGAMGFLPETDGKFPLASASFVTHSVDEAGNTTETQAPVVVTVDPVTATTATIPGKTNSVG